MADGGDMDDSEQPTPRQAVRGFLDLPREISDQIYALLFTDLPVRRVFNSERRLDTWQATNPCHILSTCRTCHTEGTAQFYRTAIFVVSQPVQGDLVSLSGASWPSIERLRYFFGSAPTLFQHPTHSFLKLREVQLPLKYPSCLGRAKTFDEAAIAMHRKLGGGAIVHALNEVGIYDMRHLAEWSRKSTQDRGFTVKLYWSFEYEEADLGPTRRVPICLCSVLDLDDWILEVYNPQDLRGKRFRFDQSLSRKWIENYGAVVGWTSNLDRVHLIQQIAAQ